MYRYVKFGSNAIGEEAQRLFDVAAKVGRFDNVLARISDFHEATAAHSIEVARLLAAFMVRDVVSYSNDEKIALIQTGIAHDAGKALCVHESILNKPSRLTEDEWQQVFAHPRVGFELMMEHGFTDFAVPVLLHHELQPRSYEDEDSRNSLLAEYGISTGALTADDKKVWIDTLLIAVADHYSSRYPLSLHQRSYIGNGRHYDVEDMDFLVKSDFIEAGRVRELGLLGFLDRAIHVAQEVALASRPLPVLHQPRGDETNIHH